MLIAEYQELQAKLQRTNNQKKIASRIQEIKQRYEHETGNSIDSVFA